MGAQISYKREAISTTETSLTFQVTREGHARFGQSIVIEVWEGFAADTGAKRASLKGSAGWPVAFTSTKADEPKATIDGVPVEETRRLTEWLGAGAAKIEGKLTCIIRVPGADPFEIEIDGFAMENLGSIDIKREGSTRTLEGMFKSMIVDGVDPLAEPAAAA